MKLSIIIPTNRAGRTAISIICEYIAFASDEIEVVIVDNSGNEEKSDFLKKLNGKNITYICNPDVNGKTNLKIGMEQASGEYIFIGTDDDVLLPSGFDSLIQLVFSSTYGVEVSAFTGRYYLDRSGEFQSFKYNPLDHDSPTERVMSFFHSAGGLNVILFSVIRRKFVEMFVKYYNNHPAVFHFNDLLLTASIIIFGKVYATNSPFFIYDMLNWNSSEASLSTHLNYYRQLDLDESLTVIHDLLLSLEVYHYLLGIKKGMGFSDDYNEAIIRYFQIKHLNLKSTLRYHPERKGKYFKEACELREKWVNKEILGIEELKKDISEFLVMVNPEKMKGYLKFIEKVSSGELFSTE
ncbi:glycosyltransferase [Magnetovirga frankeli]|uniref:glycosyltransferase n=1 Tax=Magnetovirga frankeli TaxID=947516 RepID=UPI001AF30F7B|nr:glycosyltransferase [gamma proteobacterium SS-5]